MSEIFLAFKIKVDSKWGAHLFVAAKRHQIHNVQYEYGWVQGIQLVDVYEAVYKAGLGIYQ